MVRFSHLAGLLGSTIALTALSGCTTPDKGLFNGAGADSFKMIIQMIV